MIQNSKFKSLSKTSEMLGKSEKEVFELLKFNFLEGRTFEGRLYVSDESIEKYTRLHGNQMEKKSDFTGQLRNFTIQESARIVGSEEAVHKLIQNGTLKAGNVEGVYVVYGHSMRRFARGEY